VRLCVAFTSLRTFEWLVFLTETKCVYCALRTEGLTIILVSFIRYIVLRNVLKVLCCFQVCFCQQGVDSGVNYVFMPSFNRFLILI